MVPHPPAARARVASQVALPVSPAAVPQAALAVPQAALAVRPVVVHPAAPVVPQAVVVRLVVVAARRHRVGPRPEFSTDLILSLSKDEVVAPSRHALVVRQAHHEGY